MKVTAGNICVNLYVTTYTTDRLESSLPFTEWFLDIAVSKLSLSKTEEVF